MKKIDVLKRQDWIYGSYNYDLADASDLRPLYEGKCKDKYYCSTGVIVQFITNAKIIEIEGHVVNYKSGKAPHVGITAARGSSERIILKVKLERKYAMMRMNMWGGSGFDIYINVKNSWKHHTVCGPADGYDCRAEEIRLPKNYPVMIYFPLYNVIEEMYIGSSSKINSIEEFSGPLPIAFYGQSVTQGCAATRSGNACCNIVSRKMDTEIYNFSISGACHGNVSIARQIGKLNIGALVIDYTRNSWNMAQFKATYGAFYSTIRKYHPYIPIILMTTIILNKGNKLNRKYKEYDSHIYEICEQAKNKGENTFVLDTMDILKDCWEYVAVDHAHLNDGGMNMIAERIVEILSETYK